MQFADGTIEGADVIGSNTLFTRDDSGWRVVDQDKVTIDSPDGELLVDVAQIRSASDSLLVWSWYVVGGVSTSNDYYAKLQQTLARLGFGDSVTYRVIVVTPVDLQHGDSAATLQEFVNDYGPLLYQSLRQVTPLAP